MPAVTPAEVQTGPSLMKIGLGSTRNCGCCSASCSQRVQCVTTRRPSSQPLAASRNAPVHTDATRRERRPCSLTQATSAGFFAASYTPQPPAINSVSLPSLGSGSANSANPAEDITAPPPTAMTVGV
ncbi:hypothetical protein D3C78_1576840 [compost metagenome]